MKLSSAVILCWLVALSSASIAKAEEQATDPTIKPTGTKLAQAPTPTPDPKKKKKAAAGRERYMIREGRIKGKDATKINMEEADISGAAKTPMGTLINQNKADKNYDFVKIRLNWHQEMVQSASSLETGRNR